MARAPVTSGIYSGGRTYVAHPGTYGGGGLDSPPYTAESTGMATLSEQINAINRAAQQQANLSRIPNAPALEAQSSEMIGQQLMGEVPEDVLGLLGQQAAERGISTGLAGSPAADAAYLRALGLTSIGQMEAGQKNLSAAYARSPAAPIFDVSTQLTTPYQSQQLQLRRDELAQQAALTREEMRLKEDMQRRQLEAQANLAAQEAALRSAAASGGGGGGTPRRTGGDTSVPWYQQRETGSYGGMPTAGDLFGYGTGTVSTTETPTIAPGMITQASEPSLWGTQPTSSGFMYMGSPEGYSSAYDDYLNSLINEFYAE